MSKQNIESTLLEQRSFPPPPRLHRARAPQARRPRALHRAPPPTTSATGAISRAPRSSGTACSRSALDDSQAPNYRWFTDGELNVSYNCLDVHLAERGHKTAIIFEGEPGDVRRLSYASCTPRSAASPTRSRRRASRRGDRVVIYMPMVPEAAIAMQACARIGAMHSVVFGGFSAQSLQGPHRGRRRDAADHRRRRLARRQGRRAQGRRRQGAVDGAARRSSKVIVLKRTGHDVPMQPGRDIWWHDAGRRPVAELRARVGRRRAPAVHSLHVRLHRQAQGHPALQRRLSARRQAHQPSRSSTCATTTSSGAPPTSAGSPATATSSTARSRPARPC